MSASLEGDRLLDDILSSVAATLRSCRYISVLYKSLPKEDSANETAEICQR
jgi:hypothetical protein